MHRANTMPSRRPRKVPSKHTGSPVSAHAAKLHDSLFVAALRTDHRNNGFNRQCDCIQRSTRFRPQSCGREGACARARHQRLLRRANNILSLPHGVRQRDERPRLDAMHLFLTITFARGSREPWARIIIEGHSSAGGDRLGVTSSAPENNNNNLLKLRDVVQRVTILKLS